MADAAAHEGKGGRAVEQRAVVRAAGPSDGVGELAEEIAAVRDMLHADATALAKRGLLEEASVAKLRSGLGYKNLAFDVMSLVNLFRERWEAISSKTAVQASELDAAGQLAERLITGVGLREQAPAAVGTAAVTRQKAFTLLANAYDDVRRAVTFLRWHQNDADSIAPSLYAGRGGRGSKAEAPAEPAGPLPGPATAGGITPSGVVAGDSKLEAPVAPGLPGSSPFSR